MKLFRRIISFSAAVCISALLPCSAFAENGESSIEIIPATGNVHITVNTEKGHKKISPYIYGLNDTGDLKNIYPTVIKQLGNDLSTYNWETNYSNSGKQGRFTNDIPLIDTFPSYKWDTPALYVDKLVSRSVSKHIPVRLLTLPMLGYVAKDSMGIVSDDDYSRENRWCRVEFEKNDSYLNQPDTTDNKVYVDEYISYLINRYGTSAEGGINGYFLDSEPDLWTENYSVVNPEPLTFASLVDKSSALSKTVKTMDGNAFVFGPSLSGLQGCVNLNQNSAWNSSGSEYSWFIDYYLSEMRTKSEQAGFRLLDVLDVHYYTEALTPTGKELRFESDILSNAYRMQSVRTLWDPDYAENAATVMMYKQFTPVIPTLQASIKMNYPNTRLSFSEYDFGGGDNISGAIAEADALGIFASNDVYLACLSPSSDNFEYQKAAMNIYTNYDGNGSRFGNTLVYTDNNDDYMSSAYASVDDSEPDKLRIIVTNKQMADSKDTEISIISKQYDYSVDEVYYINNNSPLIYPKDVKSFSCADNTVSFNADSTSIYMIVLKGTEKASKEVSESVWTTVSSDETEITDPESSETAESQSEAEIVSQHTQLITETTIGAADMTVPDLTVVDVPESVTSRITVEETTVSETVQITTEISEEISDTDDNNDPEVPAALKVIVSAMCFTVIAGVVYILFFDKK